MTEQRNPLPPHVSGLELVIGLIAIAAFGLFIGLLPILGHGRH